MCVFVFIYVVVICEGVDGRMRLCVLRVYVLMFICVDVCMCDYVCVLCVCVRTCVFRCV